MVTQGPESRAFSELKTDFLSKRKIQGVVPQFLSRDDSRINGDVGLSFCPPSELVGR